MIDQPATLGEGATYSDFQPVVTADGSFSLVQVDHLSGATGETMHSKDGAFSETLYIYAPLVELALGLGLPIKIFSLGLGAGYVEMAIVANMLKRNKMAALLQLDSFELSDELKIQLRNAFLSDDLSSVSVANQELYSSIIKLSADHYHLSAKILLLTLRNLLESGIWQLREGLTPALTREPNFSLICYDAFSAFTDSFLWTDEFLTHFFESKCEAECLFTTYACTGTLRRALKSSGFTIFIREGFGTKRESTLAYRGPKQELFSDLARALSAAPLKIKPGST